MADPLWINADLGAPAYSANELRQAMALALMYDGRSLGARQGVRPGGTQLQTTLVSTTITVKAGVACVDPALSTPQGPYWVALPADETFTLTPADATNPRKDITILRVYDHDEDSSGLRLARSEYLVGTAAPSPVEPSVPAGAIRLATIDVPASGGGSPVVTDRRLPTVASGGILPVASQAERDALTDPYPGQVVGRTDTAMLEMRVGSAWVRQSGMRLLGENVLSVAGPTLLVGSISQDYRHLHVIVDGKHNGALAFIDVRIRFNADAGANYGWSEQYVDAAGTVTAVGDASDDAIDIPVGGADRTGIAIDIFDYAGAHIHMVQFAGAGRIGSATTSFRSITGGGVYLPTTGITEVRAVLATDSWVIGSSLRVYGIR